MKKKIFMILAMILTLSYALTINTYACENLQELFLNDSYPEYQEIVGLKEQVADSVCSDYFSNLKPEEILNMIDLSRAYKVYVDTDLFANPHISNSELDELVSNADYVWLLPLDINTSSTVEVTFSEILPIMEEIKDRFTQEEIEEHNKMVGHWAVPAISMYEKKVDFVQTVNDAIREKGLPTTDYSIQFFGGTYGMRSIFGLVSYSNGEKYMVPVMELNDVQFERETKSKINTEKVYKFSEMAPKFMTKEDIEKTNMNGDSDTIEYGGSTMMKKPNRTKEIIAGIIVFVFLGGIYFYIQKKRYKNM